MTYACLMLPYPPTANNLFVNNKRTRGRFPSPAYKAWRDEAKRAIDRQVLRVNGGYTLRFRWPVKVVISLGRPDRRRRDLGNLEKAATDYIVSVGILADDSLIEDLRLRWDPEVIGCRVEIEELPR